MPLPNNDDTYYIATNSGDKCFLNWVADRLVHVYGESPNADFVLKLREFAEKINALVGAYPK